MFEGKIQNPAQAQLCEGKALRALAWVELTARLDAARELRRELQRDRSFGGASFADAAAAYFGSSKQNKPAVNHDALSHGNSCQRMNEPAVENAATGDREK